MLSVWVHDARQRQSERVNSDDRQVVHERQNDSATRTYPKRPRLGNRHNGAVPW